MSEDIYSRYSRFYSSFVSRVKASEVRELLKLAEGKKIISFAGGLPDPRIFPKEELAEIARQVVSELGDQALQYSPTPGVGEFRRTLAGFLAGRGVRVGNDDSVVVTTGSQEALYIAILALVDPGDTVFMEEPGYLAAINAFNAVQAKIEPVTVDYEGIDVNELELKVRRAANEGKRLKLIYTNPTCNNPNGTTMPDERRRALLEIASKYDLLVIEDDPYSYFTFDEARFTHIKSMDKEGRVIYTGTFSKILVPGLRLGWALGPEELVGKIELIKQIVDLHSSTLSQYIAMEAIRRGLVDKVIERARSLYRKKRDIMLNSLEEHFSHLATWTRPVGGFFIFVRVNGDLDFKSLMPRSLERGVAYVPGESFYVVPGRGKNTARLSYSYVREEEIGDGIRILSEVVREVLAR